MDSAIAHYVHMRYTERVNTFRAEEKRLLACIDAVFPVPAKFRHLIPRSIFSLSRLLTAERGALKGARGDYFSHDEQRGAYLRYFLPWNVFRLRRILSSVSFALSFENITNNDETYHCIDLGSGPLTFPLALWIARQELRAKKLRFYCVDSSRAALKAGEELFTRFTAGTEQCRWTFDFLSFPFNSAPFRKRIESIPKATLVTAANVFNEEYESLKRNDRAGMRRFARNAARLLARLCAPDGVIFVAEPGNPRGGEFISLLRAAFLERSDAAEFFSLLSPCLHAAECPFPALKTVPRSDARAKWCHFLFKTDTEDTDAPPAALLALSRAAELPKETAAVSFLAVKKSPPPRRDEKMPTLRARVISETFPLGTHYGARRLGCYCCGGGALLLLIMEENEAQKIESGASLAVRPLAPPQTDRKTGAKIVRALD